jgi:GCN5-related N-acetyltransferase
MAHDAREYTDGDLDEALEETFPASDPPANTVETGIVPREIDVPTGSGVVDNSQRSRFELVVDGLTSFLDYTRGPLGLTLVHTEVPESQRGRGLGTSLAAPNCGVPPRVAILYHSSRRWPKNISATSN